LVRGVLAGSIATVSISGCGVSPSVESVPWRLVRVEDQRIVVSYESGTCNASVAPRPVARASETTASVTITVLVHVLKAGSGICAGVGLGGTATAKLSRPVGRRVILHGTVTDRDM